MAMVNSVPSSQSQPSLFLCYLRCQIISKRVETIFRPKRCGHTWPGPKFGYIFRFRRTSRTKWCALMSFSRLFTSAPCSFIKLLVRWRRILSGHFWSLKRRFAWQVQDIGRLFIRVACRSAWPFLKAAPSLAGVGKNERWFWRSFCVAGVIFAFFWATPWKGRKPRSHNEHQMISAMVMGAALRMPRAHYSWQAQYFVDRHKVPPTWVKQRFWHLFMFVVHAMFCEYPTCAHATFPSLWAGRIAFILARCPFWDCSCNLLVTLCGSDRSC